MESNEEVVIEPVFDVGDIATYPSVTERYYKPRYYTGKLLILLERKAGRYYRNVNFLCTDRTFLS